MWRFLFIHQNAEGILSKSILWGSCLFAADLRGAIFIEADIWEADLTGADISDAIFSKVKNMTQQQLDQIIYEKGTLLNICLKVLLCPSVTPISLMMQDYVYLLSLTFKNLNSPRLQQKHYEKTFGYEV